MIELYTITFPDGTIYRYTSASGDIVTGGNTYTSRSGLVRGDVTINPSTMDSEATMAMPCTDSVVRAFMENPPELPVTVVIDQKNNGNQDTYYTGIIGSMAVSGIRAEMRLMGHGVKQLKASSALRYMSQCRHSLYGLGCQLDRDDHKTDGTLSAIEENGFVLVSTTFTDSTLKKWIGGAVKIGDAFRTVIGQPASTKVRLSTSFFGITSTASFTVFEGCDKSYATCRDKFDNLVNFGGIPTLPKKNPFAQSVEIGSDQPWTS